MNVFSIWFGGGPMPAISEQCMETWPDDTKVYCKAELSSIVPWLHDMPYFRDAWHAEHYAAASDVARWALLYELGGIYIDHDVEILRPGSLGELAENNTVVMGYEDDEMQHVCGAVIAAKKGAEFSKGMLAFYSSLKFADTFGDTKVTGTTLITSRAKLDSSLLLVPAHVFYPWSWRETLTDEEKHNRKFHSVSGSVMCAHHWAKTWK